MEEYESPVMEIIELENEVILTSVCGTGNASVQETSMANIF